MAAGFGLWELKLPSSRAVYDDEDEEDIQATNLVELLGSPYLHWLPSCMENAGNLTEKLQSSLLVFGVGEVAASFLRAHFLSAGSEAIGLITEKQKNDRFEDSCLEENINKCFLFHRLKANQDTVICQTNVNLPAEKSFNWTCKGTNMAAMMSGEIQLYDIYNLYVGQSSWSTEWLLLHVETTELNTVCDWLKEGLGKLYLSFDWFKDVCPPHKEKACKTQTSIDQAVVRMFEKISPSKVLVLTSSPACEYHSMTPDKLPSDFVKVLNTDSWSAKGYTVDCDFLETPNMIKDVPAAVLSHCQVHDIPAAVFMCYTESYHLDSRSVEAFRFLLTSSHLKSLQQSTDEEASMYLKSAAARTLAESNIYI